MTTQNQINAFISSQTDTKRRDMLELDRLICSIIPDCRLWFDDGINEDKKAICNPTIGYGVQMLKYADGKTREFFQIGVSANKTGISVYLIGLPDKKYLSQTFAVSIGKAKVSGYCIKFKTLAEINMDVLESAIRYGIKVTQ